MGIHSPGLPPGPPLPRVVQTAGFMLLGTRFLEACRSLYGDAVTMRTLFDDGFVMLFDPELVKELFRGSNAQLHAGEANALLGPILGERSVLLLDGDEHLRHRRLMLPPFHGRQLHVAEREVLAAADSEIDRWPLREPFTLLESMQALTLRVIVRAVFGYEAGAREDELSDRLREMVAPLANRRDLLIAAITGRGGREGALARRFAAARAEVDRILIAEITHRRTDEETLAQRDDVFSALLLARDEEGRRLSDAEVRDELVTLLLAGHETTATGLAWTFDLLLHTPEVLARARHAARLPADAPAHERAAAVRYLDAVVKEALRLRPVIPGVGRVVRGEPFQVNGYTVPEGMEINPSIRVIHRRADLYPDPERFVPERFLTDDAPDTYTWVPFGGGTRRCLGASFALMEMRAVVTRVLARTTLRAADADRDGVVFRAITLAPRHGVRVRLERRTAAGAGGGPELGS